MATRRQIEATRENLKRAQKSWHEMNRREHSPETPEDDESVHPGDERSAADDRFLAWSRMIMTEPDRLTPAQRRARQENIKKAQRARSYESWTKKELYERATQTRYPWPFADGEKRA